jgi:PAS domain S-box-containing protein
MMPKFPMPDSNFIKKLSDEDSIKQIAPEKAQDVLSIVFDAINSSVGGMIITDISETICFANPSFCRMFEYSQDEIIGKNAAGIFSTKEVKKLTDFISIIDLSNNETEEFIVERGDGRNFIVEVSASNVTSSSGQIVGRMVSFVNISEKKKIELDREKLIEKLQDALKNIKVLRGIIPICSSCKNIRDDKGYWNKLEAYIHEHSEANFTHGVCPECSRKLYPEIKTNDE